MNPITQQQLGALLAAPAADPRPGLWVGPLNKAMAACAISTPVRQAAFLAQVMHESSTLKQVQESLGYSAARLREVWPGHFASDAAAAPFSHQPEKLANHVYANRMGNGDEASGDGWRYRGRGLIQLTGRANYARFSHEMQLDALANPDLLQLPPGAALSAGWFWVAHGLNEVADATAGPKADAYFVEITKRINGGNNGLLQRRAFWALAKAVLSVVPPA